MKLLFFLHGSSVVSSFEVMNPSAILLFGAIILLIGSFCWHSTTLCSLGVSSFCASLPSQFTTPDNGPIERVCLAYEGLFRIDDRHWHTPPELLALLAIPAELANTPSDSAAETTLRHQVLRAMHERTRQYHEHLKRTGRNTAEYNHSRLVVYSWNVVADVVATAEYRRAYYEHVYSGYTWKLGLNLRGLCGKTWSKRKIQGDVEDKRA